MAFDKTSPAAGETGAASQPKILANWVAIENALGSGTLGTTNTIVQGDILYASAANTLTNLGPGTAGQLLQTGGAAANPSWVTKGAVVQVVNTQTGAISTSATAMPFDDTIPQNDEGGEFMTLAITPESATNKLKIEVVIQGQGGSGTNLGVALFQDATANALASQFKNLSNTGASTTIAFTHYMTTGTTSATTFKVRMGLSSGTVTFNGVGGVRKHGGVLASSITITEIYV